MNSGVHNCPVQGTPVAILDFETTGTRPGRDRVIEVSVLRVEPDGSTAVVLETLVNPGRKVKATEIHGITDDDVADAPEFPEIVHDLLQAVSGCVLAAYNVYFDIKFLEDELDRCGIAFQAPHFCLMYMRPMLGLGKRCTLQDACREYGIMPTASHTTADDVRTAHRLYEIYCREMAEQNLVTFGDLADLSQYKFCESFALEPFGANLPGQFCPAQHLKPRFGEAIAPDDPARTARAEYWDVLKTVVADLDISKEEQDYALGKQVDLQLPTDEIRMLHARAFATVIAQFIEDRQLDEREARKLRRLNECLRQLGWAPGD